MTRCHPNGKIEDGNEDGVMVDFANKHIGGGVLGHGCVQEEILMTIFPGTSLSIDVILRYTMPLSVLSLCVWFIEMIVSRLLCDPLDDNEALVILGPQRYSNYSGILFMVAFGCLCVDGLCIEFVFV
jgi:hypothetical protein